MVLSLRKVQGQRRCRPADLSVNQPKSRIERKFIEQFSGVASGKAPASRAWGVQAFEAAKLDCVGAAGRDGGPEMPSCGPVSEAYLS